MVNYSTDPEQITKAYKSGVITPADYLRYLQITKADDIFKKGKEDGVITAPQYHAAISTVPKFYFEKSMESGNLRFKLHVEELEPAKVIDMPVRREVKATVSKSKPSPSLKNLDELKKAKESGQIGMAKYQMYLPIFTAVDKITKLAESVARKNK